MSQLLEAKDETSKSETALSLHHALRKLQAYNHHEDGVATSNSSGEVMRSMDRDKADWLGEVAKMVEAEIQKPGRHADLHAKVRAKRDKIVGA